MTFKDHLQGFLDRDDVPPDVKSTIEEQLASYDRIATDEAIFCTLGAHLRAGLLAQDENGIVTYVNERMAHLTGYLRVDLLGRTLEGFVTEASQAALIAARERRSWGSLQNTELTLARADGQTIEVTLTPYPVFDDAGRHRGSFAVVVEKAGSVKGEAGNVRGEAGTTGSERFGDRQRIESLSPREQELLGEVLSGKRVSDIAKTLSISRHTVRNHLKAIYRKLGVHSQVELLGRFWAPAAASRQQLLVAAGARPARDLDD